MFIPEWIPWLVAVGVFGFGAYRLYSYPRSTWVNLRVFTFGLQLWLTLAVLKLITLNYIGEV